ncbi:MAG: single-stranded DNA-binding protein, partial [Dehalococcoidales bacterium]|nr:single-stranded DNA-binding protein [Dehalococcoidales bacterium]
QKIRDAEAAALPIYVLRKHTPVQLRQMLTTMFPAVSTSKITSRGGAFSAAIREAEEAASGVLGGQDVAELSPQSAYIRRLQHIVAERSSLLSKSLGREPKRRVTIYKKEMEA